MQDSQDRHHLDALSVFETRFSLLMTDYPPSTLTPSPLMAAQSISLHFRRTESVVLVGRAGNEACGALVEAFFSLSDSFGVLLSFEVSLNLSDDFVSSLGLSLAPGESAQKYIVILLSARNKLYENKYQVVVSSIS